MNRFKIRPEKEAEFKSRWLDREVFLRTAPASDYLVYASQTVWASREAYDAWRKSELFHVAHKGMGQGEVLTLEKREFSGYDVLRTVAGQEQAA
ncbi:antibiotic biosynthesis monooxygenase family protein [Acetobacter cerevisiae]|nr:antibiotic biosynthesis monooxygenase [Acetobacter cerevisiae]